MIPCRHDANILVSRDEEGAYHLTPIDHGLILPSSFARLTWYDWAWIDWPPAKQVRTMLQLLLLLLLLLLLFLLRLHVADLKQPTAFLAAHSGLCRGAGHRERVPLPARGAGHP